MHFYETDEDGYILYPGLTSSRRFSGMSSQAK